MFSEGINYWVLLFLFIHIATVMLNLLKVLQTLAIINKNKNYPSATEIKGS